MTHQAPDPTADADIYDALRSNGFGYAADEYARLVEVNKELLAALKLAASRLESGNEVDQACARGCRKAIAKAEQQT